MGLLGCAGPLLMITVLWCLGFYSLGFLVSLLIFISSPALEVVASCLGPMVCQNIPFTRIYVEIFGFKIISSNNTTY